MSRRTIVITNKSVSSGFSLIEMLISMTIGMIAIAGVMSMFTSAVKSNGDGVKQIRLNQELRAIMDVMARDIRRAGYWRSADGTTPNPYMNLSIDASNANAHCITYSYDDPDGAATPGDEDNKGFRLTSGVVKIRQNSASCGTNASWTAISDSSTVEITKLTFDDSVESCTNITSSTRDCVTTESGDTLSKMYVITITLEGQLANDNTVAYSLTETVAVRNTINEVVP